LKKLESISDKPSDAGGNLNGMKHNIYCLKYESKKLKSVSNENPVVEGNALEIAVRSI
jgi:hypothetical protein